MNVADSEEIGRILTQRGLLFTEQRNEADLVFLNTCTVRQHAEDKALSYLGRLKEWKKKKKSRKIVVLGCAAERLKNSLKQRFPQVDYVLGAKSIEEFPKLLDEILFKNQDWFQESEESFGSGTLRRDGEPFRLGSSKETAFVTIMRGCNYRCSYCIVPFVRGREIYRPFDSILKEVQLRVEEGSSEIMLLGQTVNSYRYEKFDFADLIQAVNATEGVQSIRFMSPHPHYLSTKLIQILSSCEKVSSEIHLPVQSGSDRILKLMKRNYDRQEYSSLATRLRDAIPNLKLSTDFIVGFPTETEGDFQETLSLLDEISFSLAYCFNYSPRQGTESASLLDDVPRETKEIRLAQLLDKVGRICSVV